MINGWKHSKLREIVADFIVPMRDKPPFWSGETPWCRIEDIDGKFLLGSKSNQFVDEKIIKRMNLKVFPVGTVICSCSARLGVCAIIGRELVSNQTFIGLVPTREIDAEYLYYKMISQANLLQTLSSGTTIAYLPREKFEDFEIDHPILKSEQIAIGKVLSTIDLAITQTEAIIAKQQRIKTGLMQDLLTKGIDENGNIRSEATHEFKDSAIGRIPVEWEVESLNSKALVKGGKRLPLGHIYTEDDTGYRYLQTTDFINKKLIICPYIVCLKKLFIFLSDTKSKTVIYSYLLLE